MRILSLQSAKFRGHFRTCRANDAKLKLKQGLSGAERSRTMAILAGIILKSTVLLLNARATRQGIQRVREGYLLRRQPLKNVERFYSMNASKIAPLFRDNAAPLDAFYRARPIFDQLIQL